MARSGGGCCEPSSGSPRNDRKLRPGLLDNILRRFISPPDRFLQPHVSQGMVVADLGCGAGYLSVPAAEIVGMKGKVYAVDFDEREIKSLTGKVVKKRLANIEAHTCSAASVRFIETGAADVVIAKGLLCCMHDHEGALREIHRIVKPGGEAFLSITKLARKSDRMAVGREEWEMILSGFQVESRGDGLTNRWAWVRAPRAG